MTCSLGRIHLDERQHLWPNRKHCFSVDKQSLSCDKHCLSRDNVSRVKPRFLLDIKDWVEKPCLSRDTLINTVSRTNP